MMQTGLSIFCLSLSGLLIRASMPRNQKKDKTLFIVFNEKTGDMRGLYDVIVACFGPIFIDKHLAHRFTEIKRDIFPRPFRFCEALCATLANALILGMTYSHCLDAAFCPTPWKRVRYCILIAAWVVRSF